MCRSDCEVRGPKPAETAKRRPSSPVLCLLFFHATGIRAARGVVATSSLFLAFVFVPQPGRQLAHAHFLGLKAIGLWEGAWNFAMSLVCDVAQDRVPVTPMALTFGFCLSSSTRFDNMHMSSCLASRRSVSGWGLVTHGAMVLQPNGFRFRLIPRKVPGVELAIP